MGPQAVLVHCPLAVVGRSYKHTMFWLGLGLEASSAPQACELAVHSLNGPLRFPPPLRSLFDGLRRSLARSSAPTCSLSSPPRHLCSCLPPPCARARCGWPTSATRASPSRTSLASGAASTRPALRAARATRPRSRPARRCWTSTCRRSRRCRRRRSRGRCAAAAWTSRCPSRSLSTSIEPCQKRRHMAERTGRHARAADWPRVAAARHSLAHRPVLEPGVPAGRGQGAGFLCTAQARRVGGGGLQPARG